VRLDLSVITQVEDVFTEIGSLILESYSKALGGVFDSMSFGKADSPSLQYQEKLKGIGNLAIDYLEKFFNGTLIDNVKSENKSDPNPQSLNEKLKLEQDNTYVQQEFH
jgi:hypothetical protein